MRRLAAPAALIIALGIATPAVAAAGDASRTVIYVSPRTPCSDTGQGTAAIPFCTLQNAVDAASAGTVEVIGDSQIYYAPTTVSVSGTADAPITIEPAPGTTPLIGVLVNSTSTAPAFSITGGSYVTFTSEKWHGALRSRGRRHANPGPHHPRGWDDATSDEAWTPDERGVRRTAQGRGRGRRPVERPSAASRSTASASAIQIDAGSSVALVGNTIAPAGGRSRHSRTHRRWFPCWEPRTPSSQATRSTRTPAYPPSHSAELRPDPPSRTSSPLTCPRAARACCPSPQQPRPAPAAALQRIAYTARVRGRDVVGSVPLSVGR